MLNSQALSSAGACLNSRLRDWSFRDRVTDYSVNMPVETNDDVGDHALSGLKRMVSASLKRASFLLISLAFR